MRNKQFVTAGVVLIIMGLLAGCGKGNGATTAVEGNNTSSSLTNTASPKNQLTTTNTSQTGASNTQKYKVPQWFLNDVQIAEHDNLKSGTNYVVNYGEYSVLPSQQVQMNRTWFGALTNEKNNPFFGSPWSIVYQNVKADSRPLTEISVLEQRKQGSNTVGVLVPAKSTPIGNGDFIAIGKGQVITAANKSGELFYTVYAVKGVSVPKSSW